MKFCTNCGAKLEDMSVFCPNCGNRVAAPAPVAEPAPAPVVEPAPMPAFEPAPAPVFEPTPAPVVEPPKKKKSKAPLILGIVAGVLVVAIVAVIVLSSFVTAPIKTYLEVELAGNFDKIEELAPAAYWDHLEDKYKGFSLDDAIKQYKEKEEYKSQLELAEEVWGDKFRFSAVITKYTPMPKGMVEDLGEYLDDEYGIDADSVKRGCYITVEGTLKGEANAGLLNDATVPMLNIDGKWYFVSVYETTKDDKMVTACEFPMPYFIQEYIYENFER